MPIVNVAALRDLESRLQEVERGRWLEELGTRMAVAFMKEVADEFRESRDPYGKPWKPVFRNRRRDRRARERRAARGQPLRADKPLIDTGRMRASVIARAVGSEVRVAIAVDYASYHQHGTPTIARRQILPELDTGGLGPRWALAARRETDMVLTKMLKER